MIKRDEYGIIVQHDPNVPEYADGGDSAARVGIMVAFGSSRDRIVLNWWQVMPNSGIYDCVRHPVQEQWSNPKQFSRDQFVPFLAGLSTKIAPHILDAFSGSWVNKDFLLPDVQLHRALCLKAKVGMLLKISGYSFLWLSILWACYIKPKHELNQLACQCLIAGPKWLRMLYVLHPNYDQNFRDYYSGWRDQSEISTFIILRTQQIIKEA